MAFAHGVGVASGNGTFYFVSPEQLEGPEGTEGQANLYVVKPERDRTPAVRRDDRLEPSATGLGRDRQPGRRPRREGSRHPAHVGLPGDAGRALRGVRLGSLADRVHEPRPLRDLPLDSQPGGTVECASCATTGSAATHDTVLSPDGLNVSDNGRVFFTSPEALVLTDTNGVKDAYEWSGGLQVGRLSTGGGVTALGTAHSERGRQGRLLLHPQRPRPERRKRERDKDLRRPRRGGYPFNPAPQPCAASDECHGAGSQPPPPPNINSMPPSQVPSAANRSRSRARRDSCERHGKCVKKQHREAQRQPRAKTWLSRRRARRRGR